MTIGTFGNRSVHRGIWYNIEAANASGFPNTQDLACLTQMVDASELTTLNNAINNNDYYNAVVANCCDFAVTVWNSVASSSMQLDTGGSLLVPNELIGIIRTKSGYSNSFSMTQKSAQSIAYHTRGGYTLYPAGINKD